MGRIQPTYNRGYNLIHFLTSMDTLVWKVSYGRFHPGWLVHVAIFVRSLAGSLNRHQIRLQSEILPCLKIPKDERLEPENTP